MVCPGRFETGEERGRPHVDDSWSGREGARPYDPCAQRRGSWNSGARGRGLGAGLVGATLDWTKGDGIKVITTCWFVRTVVGRYPGYRPLLER
jgi:hypothetical protein